MRPPPTGPSCQAALAGRDGELAAAREAAAAVEAEAGRLGGRVKELEKKFVLAKKKIQVRGPCTESC